MAHFILERVRKFAASGGLMARCVKLAHNSNESSEYGDNARLYAASNTTTTQHRKKRTAHSYEEWRKRILS